MGIVFALYFILYFLPLVLDAYFEELQDPQRDTINAKKNNMAYQRLIQAFIYDFLTERVNFLLYYKHQKYVK